MSKLSRKPKTVDEFLEAANGATKEASPELNEEVVPPKKREKRYPWENPKVRAEIVKGYNVRIPEPYLLKLRFIAEKTPDSMQGFIAKVLFPAIDKKIDDLIKQIKDTR
jgi:hypothetical protein